MSTRSSKRNAREADLSDSSSTNFLSELVFSNSSDPTNRSRLWNWLDSKFTKQNEYIKEQSDIIKTMIENNKSSLIAEIENKFSVLKNDIIKDVKKEINQLNERVGALETVNNDIDQLKTDVHNLNLKLLTHENTAVASDIRITGIPFHDNENLKYIFENICGTLNIAVPFYKSIFRVKHFKSIRDVKDPPIIIKLDSPFSKNGFLKTVTAYRRKYKSPLRLCNAGYESNEPFYINENLTPHNHKIFKTAIGLKKDDCLAAAYTLRGIVYVKKIESDEPVKIIFSDQLKQFFRTG